MTRIVGTPLTGIEFNAAGDEAFSSRVNLDAQPRIRIDAGGRITWSNGADAGDIKLYRTSASALGVDGVFSASLGLITRAVEAAPTLAMPDGAILVDVGTDTLYFRSGGAWVAAAGGSGSSIEYLDDLLDVVTASLSVGDFLRWNGTNWVNETVSLEMTGDYVDSISGSTGVTVSSNNSPGASVSIAIGQDVATSASVIFSRVTADSASISGTATASIFSGALDGNADTASALETSRIIELSGDVAGSVSFDGSSSVSI